jgi:nickel-dependent lactate racemase
MKVALTKHIFGDLEIPDSKLAGVFGLNPVRREGISDGEIRKAIDNPIGTGTLSEMARGKKKVLVVTDDNTRPTPLERLLPPVLDELKSAGVPQEGVTFLIGLGSHRPMTSGEIEEKFGKEIARRYKILNHAWNEPYDLVSLGTCALGFEVSVNRLVPRADLIISIGSIVPHATTGFSGGGKTVMTGIAGEKTIENTHWMALDYSMRDILGKYDNEVMKTIIALSRKVNLRMIVNAILFDDEKVYGVLAGDVEAAHREGVRLCREIYGVSIEETADVVIAEAYPADIDLRQAIKAICAADLVCRDGGVIILPAECPEGVAPQFPEFAEYGFGNPEELYREVEEGRFKQKLMAYTLVAIGRIISGRTRAILVSPHIDSDEAGRLGFMWAPELQKAVDKAFEMTGDAAKAIVLKQASVLLPVIATSERS